jgi:D-glycero-D-manno-heptose 1,7-bisphosphate phosphatase
MLVPVLSGYSSTNIIQDIISTYGSHHASPEPVVYKQAPAIFVDRDGTIVEHVEYLHEPEKVKIIPGALEALKVAQQKGYRIVIVTNQPGIGLGYFTKEDMFATNREVMRAASKIGLMIDKIYYSPYSKSDNTKCRKPNTGMIDRAKSELNVIVSDSFCVGDMTSDIQLAINAKCKSVLVKTGSAGKDGLHEGVKPDYILDSLADLASILP